MSRIRAWVLCGLVFLVPTGMGFAEHQTESVHEGATALSLFRDVNWLHWGDMNHPPMAFVLANFVLFVWLMRRTLLRQARILVRERHQQIDDAVTAAQQAKEAAQKAFQAAHAQLDQMDVLRAEWMANNQREIEQERQWLQKQTDAKIEAARVESQNRMALERMRVQQELYQRVLDAAVSQARHVVANNLRPADQQKRVTDLLAVAGSSFSQVVVP